MTRHPTDGNAIAADAHYDRDDDRLGETCGRIDPPDEEAPRGYRPKPCAGVMVDLNGMAVCDTCGIAGEWM